MHNIYYLCSKDTIPLKHQYIQPFCVWALLHYNKNNTFRVFIEANSSAISLKSAFSVSPLLYLSKLGEGHTICPDSLRLGRMKGSVSLSLQYCHAQYYLQSNLERPFQHHIQVWMAGSLQDAIILSCTKYSNTVITFCNIES